MPDADHNTPLNLLVVDDEPNIRRTLCASLTADGHRVVCAANARDAMDQAAQQSIDLALVDLRLGTETGLDLIPRLLAQSPWLRVVVITAYASVDTAVQAMKAGACDYLPKPFTPAQVRLVVQRVAQLRGLEQCVVTLKNELQESEGQIDLDSASPRMRQAVDLARQAAASDATILLRGESGTGKGVLARFIHAASGRADKPMAVISCPSLSPQLLESELFGHVRGAFTGAIRDNPGRIAACQNGTLFLDEIADLPMSLQPKLLRFLQDRQYERVGDSVTRRADVRLITATNIDLAQAVGDNRFRQDLLFRINVIQIELPPLRMRIEDILPLAQRILRFLSRGRPIAGFTPEAVAALRAYAWPGNVRELRNVIERATILCRTTHIGLEHLPEAFSAAPPAEARLGDPVPFDQIEALHIRRLLAVTPTMEEAARILGVDAATLWRKRKKYGI